MTHASLPQVAIDRIHAKHGRRFVFDRVEAARTALVVIDMQAFFVDPGAPLEVATARAAIPAICRLAEGLRAAGGRVVWVRTEITGDARGWSRYFDVTNPGAFGERVRAGLAPRSPMAELAAGLVPAPEDMHVVKDRFSAFWPGASPLPQMLRAADIDTVLIAGTLTNVCCESSARDAMAEDFSVILLADATAARSLEEQLASMVNIAGTFGDVQTMDEILAHLIPAAPGG